MTINPVGAMSDKLGDYTYSYFTKNTDNKTVRIKPAIGGEGMMIVYCGVSNSASNAHSIITYQVYNNTVYETQLGDYALNPTISDGVITLTGKPTWGMVYVVNSGPFEIEIS